MTATTIARKGPKDKQWSTKLWTEIKHGITQTPGKSGVKPGTPV